MTAPTEPHVSLGLEVDATVLGDAVLRAVDMVSKKLEGKVGAWTREEFQQFIFQILHDQRMITAKNEAVASARIFADIDGFKAAMSTPFRITSEGQLAGFVENIKEAIIPGKTQLAIAIAVVETEKVKPFGG